MDLSLDSIAAGFVFGVFGIYFIKRGKDLGSLPKIAAGLALLIFTYFVPSPWSWLLGAGLMFAGFKLR